VTLPERAARARLVYKVAPEYPGGAVNAGSSVVLKAVVGKDGTVRDLHLVSGSSQLGDAAMEAASRWQFQPYKVNGQPVEFTTELHVDFAGQ
jgi:protein TonB